MEKNALQIFSNEEFGEIRSVEINGTVWFYGTDVAKSLGYTNPRDALLKHVWEEDKNTVAICDGIPGNPNRVLVHYFPKLRKAYDDTVNQFINNALNM